MARSWGGSYATHWVAGRAVAMDEGDGRPLGFDSELFDSWKRNTCILHKLHGKRVWFCFSPNVLIVQNYETIDLEKKRRANQKVF